MAQMGEVCRRLCLAADARGYGRGNDLHQLSMQQHLLEVLTDAAEVVGFDRMEWHRQQGGDSEFAVLPDGVSEKTVVDRFVRELSACLTRHNAPRRDELRLRLRLAVHFGRIVPAANGHAGPAPVEIARILDSPELHAALDDHPARDLAVALSNQVYEDTVLQGHTTHRPADFRRVAISKKEFTGTAWIWEPHGGALSSHTERPERPEPPHDAEKQHTASPSTVQTTVNGSVHGQDILFGIRNG
jgi:hypothetical protein